MARFITGIRNKRMIVTVPVSGPVGCIVPVPADCCEGGSGSGSGGSGGSPCTNSCDQCVPMSGSWALTIGTDPEPIYLNRVSDPNDGNECRFVSADLVWDLYYDYDSETWFLVNYSTEDVWFLIGSSWLCKETNILANETEGGDNAGVTPIEVCTSWNCVDGTCVEVPNLTGTYPTESDCTDVCGVTPAPCDGTVLDAMPATLYLVVPNSIAWTCMTTPGTYTMTASGSGLSRIWESGTGPAIPSTDNVSFPCAANNNMTLKCVGSHFALASGTSFGGGSGDSTAITATVSPVLMTFNRDAGVFDRGNVGQNIVLTVHQ